MFSTIVSFVLLANVVSASPVNRATTTDSEMLRTRQEERVQNRQEILDEALKHREEFRQRVANIKDEKKQQILINIDERFLNVNEKWTTHWNAVLDRLTEILAKIETKYPSADTAAAKAAIESARAEVTLQAEKTYEMDLTDEENVRVEVKAQLALFKQDLRAVETEVKAAREEVVKVYRNLENEEN